MRYRLLSIGLLALSALVVEMAGAEAIPQEDANVAGKMKARQQEALPEAHRASIERRNQLSKRLSGSELHQFQQNDGSITFTNRPDKYERDRRYERVAIKYEAIVVPPQYQKLKAPQEYTTDNIAQLIEKYAEAYALDANLVYAVIKAESNFQPNAQSPAGACGLMQLMPGTAAEMGVTEIFDPAQNIAGGSQYLSRMLELFNGDVRLALAGYNAGPENVKKYAGIPPFEETQNYVNRVLRFHNGFTNGGADSRYAEIKQVRGSGSRTKIAKAAPAAPVSGRYVVHFHSGLTQPADEVEDQGNYWYVKYGARVYPVRKALVSQIEEPA